MEELETSHNTKDAEMPVSVLHVRYGDFQRVIRLISKPLRVQKLGCVMGKILDLQKRYILENSKRGGDIALGSV